jgi:hypothetical protein
MNKNDFLQCPWCPCIFFNQVDLDSHLHAFRILGKEPNQYDHRVAWQIELRRRKQVEDYGEPE